LALALPTRSPAVNVSIDATHAVRTVDNRVFGLNTVIWDPQTASAQTLTLMQAADVRVIRLPGGSLSDAYDWSTNRGYASPGVLNTWRWSSGFDKFSQIVTGLNCQAFVTVNYGSGTPEQAAAWVAYANASSTLAGTASDVTLGVDANGTDWKTAGYWSALRAASPLATDDDRNFLRLGRATPFGLKYWEIGNECYGSWETDYQAAPQDPYTYATRVRDYAAKMRVVDPTIKVGVVVTTGEDSYANYTNHPATNPRTSRVHNGWTPVLLATLKTPLDVTPDFAIYHRYEQTPGLENDATLLQKAATWPNDAADLRQQLSDYLGTAGVELVVTENNSVFSNTGKQTTSLVNGLFLADSIGHVLQTEINALVWWDLRNGQDNADNNSATLYGWRQYGDYGVLSTPSSFGSTTYYDAYPTYYVMKLLSHFARGGDTVVSATSDSTLLAVYAAHRADGTLSLLVLNKSPTDTVTANFALTGFTPQAAATMYAYGIPQDDAARTGMGSTDIATATLNSVSTTFAIAFTPYSATVLALTPTPLTITTQPMSQIVTLGNSAMFSVLVGSGSGPTYQWQRRPSGGTTWTNLSDNATYSGSTTATLTVNSVTTAMNGDSFQCVVANANGSVTSNAAPLTVNAAPATGGGSSGGGGGGAMGAWFVLALAASGLGRGLAGFGAAHEGRMGRPRREPWI
jgi:hypothetical protein